MKTNLDSYFQKQAKQDMKRHLSVVFTMAHGDHKKDIIGYYTLSNDSIQRSYVPDELAQKMPSSYENLPVTLLGRLPDRGRLFLPMKTIETGLVSLHRSAPAA